jgi:hypothetical protein
MVGGTGWIARRDPRWEAVWGRLDRSQRKDIGRALWRGSVVRDVRLTLIAAEAARRTVRSMTRQAIICFTGVAVQGAIVLALRMSDPNWWFAGWFTLMGVVTLFGRARAKAAEAANRAAAKAARTSKPAS